MENFRGRKGFNDTGIPLTAKAAKQLQKNRASYRSRYVGTTLQQINEERAAAAKERWKHLRVDSNHSADTAPTKRGYSSAELTWSNSAKESRDRYYGYSDKKIIDVCNKIAPEHLELNVTLSRNIGSYRISFPDGLTRIYFWRTLLDRWGDL